MGRLWNNIPMFFMITCLVFTSLFINTNAADETEVENEHPFTYLKETEKGPENWGHLDPKWTTCRNGKSQSPVDIVYNTTVVSASLGSLRKTFKPAPAVIKNRGHDIMLAWQGDAGGVVINGIEYRLLQCHWHTPSEHTVNGKSFNMELHMLHNSSRGDIAVVAVLYKLGRPDSFLKKLLQKVETLEKDESPLGIVNPWDIRFGSRKYFRYVGSLTVPPCTEGILWTVVKKVRTASIEQIRAMRQAVNDGFEINSRPTQKLEGRTVYMYRPDEP